jgi:hypothetical protein
VAGKIRSNLTFALSGKSHADVGVVERREARGDLCRGPRMQS